MRIRVKGTSRNRKSLLIGPAIQDPDGYRAASHGTIQSWMLRTGRAGYSEQTRTNARSSRSYRFPWRLQGKWHWWQRLARSSRGPRSRSASESRTVPPFP